jgi:hypothetical protein
LAAAHQEIDKLEEEIGINKCCSAMLEMQLEMCKLELSTEQTNVTQLRLEKDMLLPQVKDISSQKTALQSELRAFKCVIQQLITNRVHATPVPNTFTEPTPGPSGSLGTSADHDFSIKSSNLLMYHGKRTMDNVTAILFALEGYFKNAAQAIRWVSTMGCGEQAVLQ